jgi:hypothetical protein
MSDTGEKVKKVRRWGCLTLSLSHFIVMGLTAGGMLLYWYMPGYLGGKLLPLLAEAFGIKGITAQVEELGLNRAIFEKVLMKLDGNRVMAADSIQVEYRLPYWPMERDIKLTGLKINGARIKIIRDGDQWRIPGIYPELLNKTKPVKTESSSSVTKIDKLGLLEVALTRCTVQLESGKTRLEFPFSVRFNSIGERNGKMVAGWKVQCAGDVFRGKWRWQRQSGRFETEFNGSFNLENYLALLPAGARNLAARTTFTGEVFGDMNSTLETFTGTVKLNGLRTAASGWELVCRDPAAPALLNIKYTVDKLDYTLSNLALTGPATLQLNKISGSADWDEEEANIEGEIASQLDAGNKRMIKLKDNLPLRHQYNLNWDRLQQKGNWTYSVKEELPAGTSVKLELGPGIAHFKELRIDSSGAINCNPAPSENDLDISMKLSAGPLVIWEKPGAEPSQKPLIVEISAPLATALITKSKGQLHGGVCLESEGVRSPGLQLKTGKLKAELPLMRLAASGGSGTVRLQQVCFQNKELMDVDLTVKDLGSAIVLDGILKQRILPGADWKCHAFLQLQPVFSGRASVSFGPYNLAEPLQAGSYFPKLEGMSLSGNIEGSGEFNFRPDSKTGKAALHLTDGVFKSKQSDLTAEGIESILVFPALPELRTLPLQVLRCKTLRAGTVNLTGLSAEYQIEPGNAFLLENFSANWCGGRIYTQALRVTPGQQNLKAVLYCDGLILSRVLAEMGIAKAIGVGAIHGRMPLSFGPQGIFLEPGYLYSEPGGKQNIRIEGMEKAFEGFPPESVQASQAEVATEALKNFDYEWVKVNFANTGDTLRLEMQLDGRPAEPLPFKYDSKRGGFVRVNGEKAIFQGIRLDVNTNIPLNQMLRFNNNIKNLFGGKKP